MFLVLFAFAYSKFQMIIYGDTKNCDIFNRQKKVETFRDRLNYSKGISLIREHIHFYQKLCDISKSISCNEFICTCDFSTASIIGQMIKGDLVYINVNQGDYSNEIFNFSLIKNHTKILVNTQTKIYVAGGDFSYLITDIYFDGIIDFKGKFIGNNVYLINSLPRNYLPRGSKIYAKHAYSDSYEQLMEINAPKKTLIVKNLEGIKIHVRGYEYFYHGARIRLSNVFRLMVNPYDFSTNITFVVDEYTIGYAKPISIFFENPSYALFSHLHNETYLLKIMDFYTLDDLIKISNAKIGFNFIGNWKEATGFELKIIVTPGSMNHIDTSGIPSYIKYKVKQKRI